MVSMMPPSVMISLTDMAMRISRPLGAMPPMPARKSFLTLPP